MITKTTEATSHDEYEKEFMIEVYAKIAVKADELPDDKAIDIINKIKTRVFCNREQMTIVGIRTDVYEVYDETD